MKAQILEVLGESELRRAAQVDAALAANDRIKYYFSLLQMAMAHADDPEQPPSSLRRERRACGIEESGWDDVSANSRREGAGYSIPGCAKILDNITQELRVMAAPVLEAAPAGAEGPAAFESRLEKLIGDVPAPQGDLVNGPAIERMTRAGTRKADSLHQLVMDIHKRLNALQGELAEERVDGAAVYRIDDADRPLVSAFMTGVKRTAPLKFGHPGLDTTVTRSGAKLVIQNDIGCTDAHVIVIHVEGLAVTVTYTDVHPERAQFFRVMLGRYPVAWNGDREGRLPDTDLDADFTMLVGAFLSSGPEELEQYLSFLGSRLVFLIDWNRARKQLRGFLRGPERAAVLSWAAKEEVGHRGFLELGGAHLINQAIEQVAGSAFHFGDRLCDVLGKQAAAEFVQFVFRAAEEGLKEHQSPRLILDRVCAELQAHFASEGQRLLLLAGEHAGFVFELASQVREGIRGIATAGAAASEGEAREFQKLANRARALEHDADQIVVTAREAVRRRPEYSTLFQITETADDAADELEEVAFLLGLLHASSPGGEALDTLSNLSNLLLEGAQEWVKALAHAARVKKAGQQEDAEDFLLSVDRLLALEHQADDAERALTYVSVQHARNFRQLHLYAEIGKSLEAAADALKGAALMTRDHLFASVLGA